MLVEYKRLLVAMDGSPQSEKAYLEATSIAKRNKSKVFLTWIINDSEFSITDPTYTGLLNEEKVRVEEMIANRIHEMQEAGVEDIEVVIEMGAPKQMLATELPARYDIDLIIMGSTGKDSVQQMLVGSTTSYVVNQAPCNVMVIK